MTHPNSLDLEAFACGDEIAAVSAHVDACEACRTFVDKLRDLPIPKIDLPAATATVTSIFQKKNLAAIALPLAAAAILVLVLRDKTDKRAGDDVTTIAPATATATGPDRILMATADPTTSFKGVRQVAVIRERDGEQKRFTGRVPVKEGDRLRIEVAIDREQSVVAGVLSEDGSYLELMPGTTRAAGTHYSEKSARVSAPPSNGTILVGTAEQVERAKKHLPTTDLDEVRVEWEPSR
jgi:hypothetical protein